MSSPDGAARPVRADVCVVIPTLGRPILEECLARIAAGSAWPAELIVVDQSESEQVAGWIQRLRARGLAAEHVPSRQRGKSAALNRGIERVVTPFVAITDDDCFVDQDWLATLVDRLVRQPDAIVTGPAYAAGAEAPVAVVTTSTPRVSRRPGLQFDQFCGSNMGASLATMHRVGPFDEDPCFFAAAEDCEWSYRALRAGVPIVYTTDVVVRHLGWRSTDERYARYRAYARSHGSFYGKYLRRGDPVIAVRVVLHHARALKRWLSGLVTGNREATLNGRAYTTGLMPGIMDAMRRRAT